MGSHIRECQPGDRVGCIVDSCGEYKGCKAGNEQCFYAGKSCTDNSLDRHPAGHAFAGYWTSITVNQGFVLCIPGQPAARCRSAAAQL